MTAPPLHPPRERAPRHTLGAALGGRDNALNFIRLILASAVIVGHTWALGGFGSSPWEGMAGLAVNGFFVISGFLIAGSRARTGFASYVWRRVLRILPAFWTALVVVAFGIAPLGAVLAGETWHPAAAWHYVVSNVALRIREWGVEGTLLSVPVNGVWNSPVWTLIHEFNAYLAAGVLLFFEPVRRHPALWCGILFALGATVQLVARGPLEITTAFYLDSLRLGVFFLAGMLMWALRDRLYMSAPGGIGALASVAVLVAWPGLSVPLIHSLTALPLAYGLLWLGGALPVRIGAVNDVSYGIYIYAWPVQQLLAVLDIPALLGFWGYAALAWILTLPLAWLSWQCVEKPAMRWKDLVRNTRSQSRSHMA